MPACGYPGGQVQVDPMPKPAALGLSNYTFALAMLLGWVIGMMVAPFSGVALILSGVTGKNSFENSVMLNWKFAIQCAMKRRG